LAPCWLIAAILNYHSFPYRVLSQSAREVANASRRSQLTVRIGGNFPSIAYIHMEKMEKILLTFPYIA
jgi:hypothetical protein